LVYADLANLCSAADLLHVFASPLAKVVGSAAIRSGCAYLRVRKQAVMQQTCWTGAIEAPARSAVPSLVSE
jgi:hypothetical protein